MSKVWWVGLFVAIAGCGPMWAPQDVTPFPDRPEVVLEVSARDVVLQGVVWVFEANGAPLVFGGPLGFDRTGERAAVIAISGTGLDLTTESDVLAQEPADILRLIEVAEAYCVANGAMRNGVSIGLVTQDGVLNFVEFCAVP